MTKDSIWAAMGPSGSLSDDAPCSSFPSSCPPEGSSVGDLWAPGRRGSTALGAAPLCSLAAFVEGLWDKERVRGLPGAPTPGVAPIHIPFALWFRALLGDQDSGRGVRCQPLCLLCTGSSDVFLGDGAWRPQGPAGRLVFHVHVILETCHQRVPTWGLPIAAEEGGAGQWEVTREVESPASHPELQTSGPHRYWLSSVHGVGAGRGAGLPLALNIRGRTDSGGPAARVV